MNTLASSSSSADSGKVVATPARVVVREPGRTLDAELPGEASQAVELAVDDLGGAAFLSLGTGDDVRYRSAMHGERHRRASLDRGNDLRGVVAKVSHRYIHVPQRSTRGPAGPAAL